MVARNKLFEKLVNRVSKKLNKDPRVVEFVIRQQFRFIAKEVIADPNSERSYRAFFLGAFTPKTTKRKKGIVDLQPET